MVLHSLCLLLSLKMYFFDYTHIKCSCNNMDFRVRSYFVFRLGLVLCDSWESFLCVLSFGFLMC